MYAPIYYLLLVSGLYLATVLALAVLVQTVPAVAFRGRMALSFIILTGCAIYGVLASIVLRLSGYGGLSQWTTARSFKWSMGLIMGVWFVIHDEQHLTTRPAVFVGNHQTELDVLMLAAIFPPYCSVTAKKQLKWVPFLGWFMALSKTVFIDRGNRASAKSAVDNAARTIQQERQSVFIFPEGTRSYTTKAEMLPFKKGAFHLAVQAKVPIVPVVVANYANILRVKNGRFNRGSIPIRVLPPIPTDTLTADDVNQLLETTRAKMLEELVKMTELAQEQGVAPAEDTTPAAVRASGAELLR